MNDGKIISIAGNNEAGTITSDPAEFAAMRDRYEKQLDEILRAFGDAIRNSPVATPDVNALMAHYNKRWNALCDVAEKKDLMLNREAFVTEVNRQRAKAEEKRMFNGPITPAALTKLGFRQWKDGTWRTLEVVVEPVGPDWRIDIHHDLVGAHHLPFLLQLTTVAGIKHLTPFNEPAPEPRFGWRRWFGKR